MLKCIIFDMDGTITLTEQLHFKAFDAVFRAHGVNDFTFEEEQVKYAGSGSKNIFTKVFADRGIAISPEELEKCVAEKRELYKKIVQESEISVVAGVKEFVEMLDKRGIKRIIATGNSDLDAVRFILEKVGLAKFFPDILSISEVPRGKPFPDVFIEAAKRMGCEKNECVVLEDAINGVEAAKAAGIRCIALATTTKTGDLLKAGADEAVKDYNELSKIFNFQFLI